MMNADLTSNTERLRLRPLAPADAPQVRLLAGDLAVSDTALGIPYPFSEGEAEQWIAEAERDRAAGVGYVFAILKQEGGAMVGSVDLHLQRRHHKAELGYWIGRPWWGLGYATEAGRAVLQFGFEQLGLNRIYANHIGENPASGRVMTKLGMRCEGTLREDAWHQDRHVDLVYYGILRSEYPR
jgi:ribosomal-protein-alanine N-acetyltransferase